MAYWNNVEIVERDDIPGHEWWKAPPDGLTHGQHHAIINRKWAEANAHLEDSDIVDEIVSMLREAEDRSGSDMIHYIGQAEHYIELLQARAELKMEKEDEEEEEEEQEYEDDESNDESEENVDDEA